MNRRAAVVLGTRPEIIKLAGVIRLLGPRGAIVHTGQHYDPSLSEVFFEDYRLPAPALTVSGVGGRSRGEQFAAIVGQLTESFADERPTSVLVQGDTNTAAAAAQAAHFLQIPVVHVEAGLRSYDRDMPEEINRRLIGVVADLHCAPTDRSKENLVREGVSPELVAVTGNTVVEATLEMLPEPDECEQVVAAVGAVPGSYLLATVHRPENTDDPGRLEAILKALASIGIPVVFPAHPRTIGRIDEFGLRGLLDRLTVIEPVDHRVFLALAWHARLLVSDSGGVQEECTVLKRPLVVVRNSTERPEAVEAGFARRVEADATLRDHLLAAVEEHDWASRLSDRPSPFGDGHASASIVAEMDARGLLGPGASA